MIKRVVKKSAIALVKSRKSNLGLVMAKKKSALVKARKQSALVSRKRVNKKVVKDVTPTLINVDVWSHPNLFVPIKDKKVSKFKKFIKKVMQVIKFQLNYTYKHRYNRRYRN